MTNTVAFFITIAMILVLLMVAYIRLDSLSSRVKDLEEDAETERDISNMPKEIDETNNDTEEKLNQDRLLNLIKTVTALGEVLIDEDKLKSAWARTAIRKDYEQRMQQLEDES